MSCNYQRYLPINLETVRCPQCKQVMPRLRLPANVRELLWGGWTCPQCGRRLDKWGNDRSPRP